MEKTEYLEHRTSSDLKLFYCRTESIEMIALKSSAVDLKKLKNISPKQLENIEVFKADKKYSKNREEEIYEMTKQGCEVTDHKMFRLLKQMVK